MKRGDADALRQFDQLPGSANVRLPVVAALFAISPATVWRWTKAGRLPTPSRIAGVTVWNVAALRQFLGITRQSQEDEAVKPPGAA